MQVRSAGERMASACCRSMRNEASPYYGLECKPTPEDFEKDGDVPMPEYGDNQWPLPGVPWEPQQNKS